MKDFRGKELKVGDKVAFILKDSNAHNLASGTVVRFEKQIGELCVIAVGKYKYKIRSTKGKVIIL